MSDQFLGEIRMFGTNFAPKGWALCNGQLIPLSQNTALFALLGTMYGGDGKSTFALPDLIGRAPLSHGQVPGLTGRLCGDTGGAEHITLLQSETPAHTHTLRATSSPADVSSPTATTALARSTGKSAYHALDGNATTMAPQVIAVAGGDQPHNNLMPYLVFTFSIALQGIFPHRP